MSKLYVGAARVDISPAESVPLAGFGRSSGRMSEGVSDPLTATCLAFSQAGETVLVFTMDQGNMYDPLPSFREDVAAATGLSRDRVMFCATHTHSAPHLSNKAEPTIPRYCEFLRTRLVECGRQAVADLAPASLASGAVRTQNMNFVRRYVLADGTYAGDNYGHPAQSPIVAHEAEPDRILQVLKVTREGRQDLVLVNFQGHPHKGAKYRYTWATSDLVHYLRRQLEADTGCLSAYFSGASGNMNCTSRIPEENITADYMDHGRCLAQYAQEALKNLKPLHTEGLGHQQLFFLGKCNHLEDHKLEVAKIAAERWNAGAKSKEAIAGFEDQLSSPYHALSIITKAARPQTMEVELCGLAVGDFAMMFAPFELFSQLGQQIKAASPFGATFVCCYANALFSYMPTLDAFDRGGYGPGACRFEPGTGELLVEQYIHILNKLKESKL